MSHPKRSFDVKKDENKLEEVLQVTPSSTTIPDGHTNFISGNYHYANLLAEAGKVGFASSLGESFNGSFTQDYFVEQSLPGIMAIDIVPTIGRSDNINSGVNLAAKSIFTGIRRANQGQITYDPADVMLYLLGIDSVVLIMAHLRRAMRVAQNYEWKNRFTSDALLQSMGIVSADLRKNFGNYITRMDMMVTKAQKLIYLRDFPLIADHAMMFSEVFSDGEEVRSQLYVLRPAGCYRMEMLPDNPKQVLVWMDLYATFYASPKNFSVWLDTVETMINNIAYINTYSTIAGQIEKAYGANTTQLPISGDLTPLKPSYNPDFGWVLQNANLTFVDPPSLNIFESLTIDGNLGALICKPVCLTSVMDEVLLPFQRYIYTTHDSLSSEEVFQATRWMVIKGTVGEDPQLVVGSDFPVRLTIFTYKFPLSVPTLSSYVIDAKPDVVGDVNGMVTFDNVMKYLGDVSLLTNFKWFPYFGMVGKRDTVSSYLSAGTIGNIDNYALLDNEMLKVLQDVRQLENFYIENLTTIS